MNLDRKGGLCQLFEVLYNQEQVRHYSKGQCSIVACNSYETYTYKYIIKFRRSDCNLSIQNVLLFAGFAECLDLNAK